MRLFLITVLSAMFVCLSFGQEEMSNYYQRPSNPITNFFKNLFGGSRRPEVRDPLTNADFESSLAQGTSDRMVNNAIEQGILAESNRQQTEIDSPFIKPSNESVNDKSIEQIPLNHGVFSNSREGYAKGYSNGRVSNSLADKIPISEALRIVSTSNLTDCVARVICELSCDTHAFGAKGRTVFRNLLKLQFDSSFKTNDATFYRVAAGKGRQLVQSKKSCKECETHYPTCKSSSEDLVAVASMFKL